MPTPLNAGSRPSGATLLRLALVALNLGLLVTILGVLHGLFYPGAVEDPLPDVVPVALALDAAPQPSEFGDLIELVRSELDAPLPEPEPPLTVEASAPTTPLSGWGVVALLMDPDHASTAILGSAGRQVTVQAGDAFLGYEVRAIEVDTDTGSVRVEVAQGGELKSIQRVFTQ